MKTSFVGRREFLQTTALGAAAAVARPAWAAGAAPAKRARPYNVLLLMADDARPWFGCYGVSEMKTPNIDRLAAGSVLFDHAYCQYPVCNPSRTSMLTGRYPNKTRQVLNGIHHFRDIHPDWVTLPQHFKQYGYATANSGKIFHGLAQDHASWTEWVADYVPEHARRGRVPVTDAPGEDGKVAPQPRYRVLEGNGEEGPDYWIAESGIKFLNKYKDRPFFIAVGLHAPHAAPTAARRFYDLYPLADMKLPRDFATRPTVPPGCPDFMLPATNDVFYMKVENTPEEAKEVIRGYHAAVSNADWNLGRVLDALARLGLAENTIVVFTADHGYHNGEKGRWGKTTVFEVAQRVPLIVRVPGGGGNGRGCQRTVQHLDLYPTLCELCGLPQPAGLQGHSLASLLADPKAAWAHPACGMSRTGGPLGYTVRTERYRYAEWDGGKTGSVLFDHASDPLETINLASTTAHASTVAEMKRLLAVAFENDMPSRIPATEPKYVPAHKSKAG
jgi:arylsulfatase A-like enzyme